MSAITAVTGVAAAPLRRVLRAFAVTAAGLIAQVAGRIRNRRDAARLASLDDRMLADIGLTRSDLRDAYAEPLWHDPTDVLARRAAERRTGRRPVLRCRSDNPSLSSTADAGRGWRRPRADRDPRLLV